MIFCRTLGPVAVSVEGAAASAELLWRTNLALLVYLARSPKRARTREHLIGLLWGDKPESAARHSLNEAIRVLRRHAGEAAVESDSGQVRLAARAVELDADRFQALVTAKDYGAAAELAAGEFLEGFSVPGASGFDDWLAAERTVWRGRCADALLHRAEELLAGGHVAEASDVAQRALGLAPTSDPAVRAVMRSLALAGERARALECFAIFAARLASELGTEPDAETKSLAERVRRERTWQLPPRATAAPEAGAESRRPPLVGRAAELERLLDARRRGRPARSVERSLRTRPWRPARSAGSGSCFSARAGRSPGRRRGRRASGPGDERSGARRFRRAAGAAPGG